MKPYGMNTALQIIKPTRTEDKVWEAVEEARLEGWELSRLVSEVEEAWVGIAEKEVEYAKLDVRMRRKQR